MTHEPQEKPRFLDKPRNVRKMLWVFFAGCVVLLLLDGLGLRLAARGDEGLRHANRTWEGWFGFYCVFGFVACVILVVAAKGLRKLLMRGEDYY